VHIHQQATKNVVHAERFYVAHQVYDRNNMYNSILKEALDCINKLSASSIIKNKCAILLLDFPECNHIKATEKLFSRIQYDRKTARYRHAIELARIILLNYHPDFKGGSNNILAIMVDINMLWENYIYFVLKRTCNKDKINIKVYSQQRKLFWQHPIKGSLRLKPDLLIVGNHKETEGRFILDTKWKYRSGTSIEDVRQMYAYGHYFSTEESYLLYPDKLEKDPVEKFSGCFYKPGMDTVEEQKKCGLIYIDLLDEIGNLKLDIGDKIIDLLY
jgi:5-methylcytosine-specific restriction enzyme subunit McrC